MAKLELIIWIFMSGFACIINLLVLYTLLFRLAPIYLISDCHDYVDNVPKVILVIFFK